MKKLYVLIIVAAIAMIGIGGYLIFTNNSNTTKHEDPLEEDIAPPVESLEDPVVTE